ncbi:dihydrofolate reductase family protein [Actinoplanes sp. NPDC026619]|uniref:dihydrofolate reductase family protein n=1 Tax=Actinoplanes sp. NPDC026619 TaxID=3155798 RepID=UPI0033D74217
MARIIVSENINLEDAGSDPDSWFGRISDPDRAGWAEAGRAEAVRSAAMLMGRRTYEWLAPRWPGRTGEWADRLNSMPKFVVSSTLESPAWSGTTVLSGDVASVVGKLKAEIDGDIVVPGSAQLVRTLLEHDLVDELQVFVFPFLAGNWRRTGAEKIGDGVTLLSFQK